MAVEELDLRQAHERCCGTCQAVLKTTCASIVLEHCQSMSKRFAQLGF